MLILVSCRINTASQMIYSDQPYTEQPTEAVYVGIPSHSFLERTTMCQSRLVGVPFHDLNPSPYLTPSLCQVVSLQIGHPGMSQSPRGIMCRCASARYIIGPAHRHDITCCRALYKQTTSMTSSHMHTLNIIHGVDTKFWSVFSAFIHCYLLQACQHLHPSKQYLLSYSSFIFESGALVATANLPRYLHCGH